MTKLIALTIAPRVLYTGINFTDTSLYILSLYYAHCHEKIQNKVFATNATLYIIIVTVWKGSNVYRYLKNTLPPIKVNTTAMNALAIQSVIHNPS